MESSIRAASVAELLERATNRARLARAADAASIAAAALFIGLWAARASTRVGPLTAADWIAAALGALAAGATWWLERRPEPAEVARAVDVELALDGAFVTAVEVEARGSVSAIGLLLAERTLRSLAPRKVLAAVRPPSLALVAVALASAAAFAVQGDAPRERAARTGPLARALALAAADARAQEQSAAAGELDHLAALLGERGADSREVLARIAAALERLGPSSAGDLERSLADTAFALAAIRSEGGGAAGDSGVPGANHTPASDRALANGGAERTISGFPNAPQGATGPRTQPADGGAPSSSASGEIGSSGVRWWNARHDPVVERWLESRRAAAAGNNEESRR